MPATAARPECAARLDDDIARHARRSSRRARRGCRERSRHSTPTPTCSSSLPASRATAWPMPRLSRTACRYRNQRGRDTGHGAAAGHAGRRRNIVRWRRRCAASSAIPICGERSPWRRGAGGGRICRPGSIRGDFFARARGLGMSGFSPMARAARALRSARAQSGRSRRRVASLNRYPRRGSSISPAAPARPCARWPASSGAAELAAVDNDLGLLARATATPQADGSRYRHPPRSQPRSRSGARWAGRSGDDLGTARSRFRTWLDRLAVEIAARSIPLYAALSYDGRIGFSPPDPLDAADHRRGERASAHRQGLRAGTRAGGGGFRRSRASKRSAIRSYTAHPTG